MKLFDRRMSTGWSFVLGMLFGALLVFAKIGTSSVTRVSGHEPPDGSMNLPTHAASFSPALERNETNETPSPAISGSRSRSRTTPSRETRHSECELQLD